MPSLRRDQPPISGKFLTETDVAVGKSVMSDDGGVSDSGANSDSDIDIRCSDAEKEEWVCSSPSSPSSHLSSHSPPSPQNKAQRQLQASTSVYSTCLAAIFKDHTKLQSWRAGPINFTVSTSLQCNDPMVINLTPTIGHKKHPPKQLDDSTCYFLPCSMNKTDEEYRRKFIYPVLIRACAAAGFKTWCRYVKRRQVIIVECVRSIYHKEESIKKHNAKNKYVRKTTGPGKGVGPHMKKTQRPIRPSLPVALGSNDKDTLDADDLDADTVLEDSPEEDERDNVCACPFKFCACWSEDLSRWFFPHKQAGTIEHKGRPAADPRLLRLRTCVVLDENERNVAKDSQNSHLSSSSSRNLLATRTGHTFEWHQMQKMKNRDKSDLLISSGMNDPLNGTAVNRLIHDVSMDKTMPYIMLFAEKRSGLLTIKQKRMSPNKATEIDDFNDDLGDIVDSPMQHAESLRDRRIHTETGQILLCFSWACDESRRKFDMYPEIAGADETEEINSEERGFYTVCGKYNENQVYVISNTFMPSSGQWAFSWVLKIALPYLHPGTALSRLRKFNTDADPQEVRSVEATTGKEPPRTDVDGILSTQSGPSPIARAMPNARHGLCAQHRLDRNLVNDTKYKALIAAAKDESAAARAEVDMLRRWLWQFTKTY